MQHKRKEKKKIFTINVAADKWHNSTDYSNPNNS